MQVIVFTGSSCGYLLTPQQPQAKPTREALHASLFLLLFSYYITWRRTHFYSLAISILFGFPIQAVCQLGSFNLPVGLA